MSCLTYSYSNSQSLKHNPNGRFVVVCGDGEYIIYTALAWRNRSFGSGLEFVWSSEGECAVRESSSKIKIFSKNFQVCYSHYGLTHTILLEYDSRVEEIADACNRDSYYWLIILIKGGVFRKGRVSGLLSQLRRFLEEPC